MLIENISQSARAKVYSAANFAMVEAYWEIGKSIVEKQGGNATAEYGSRLLKELSKQMTADFGKGFTVTNLSYMRQFYLTFQNHHRLLLNKARRIKNKPFWTFSISFEEAKQYRRKYLNVLTRESQWEEIIVDVYL